MFKWIAIWLMSLIPLTACVPSKNKLDDPKQTLADYISQSFTIKTTGDKQRLMNFLTGEVKNRLASWSDDQFRNAFIDTKREFIKLSFREINEISPQEVRITYELTYIDSGKKGEATHEARIINKKLCQLVFEKNRWLIASVRNLKELIEYSKTLSLP